MADEADSERPSSSSKTNRRTSMGSAKRGSGKEKKSVRIVNSRNAADRNNQQTVPKKNNGRAHVSQDIPSQSLTVLPLGVALKRAKRLRARPPRQLSDPSFNKKVPIIDEAEKRALENFGYVIYGNVEKGVGFSKHWACVLENSDSNSFRRKINVCAKVVEKENTNLIADLKTRELKILCQLKHPNIVSLHSVLLYDKHVYVFSTRNAFGSVLEYLSANGPLSENHGRFWFRQILNGLEYLHTSNISHRNLNCETVLFSDHYNVLIADFTHAEITKIGNRHVLSNFVNKSLYSAPEVLLGEQYNAKLADLWSLGIILYAFYLGHPPFQFKGDEDQQIVRLVLDQLCKVWLVKKHQSKIKLQPQTWVIIYGLLEPDELKRATVSHLKKSPFYSMKECICGYGSFKYFMRELSASPPAKLMSKSKTCQRTTSLWELQKRNDCPAFKEFYKPRKRTGLKIEEAEEFPIIINVDSEESLDLC